MANVYNENNFYLLFGLLNVGTLKFPPNMATLTSSAKAQYRLIWTVNHMHKYSFYILLQLKSCSEN